MTQDKAREIIVRDWMALHPDLRSSDKQIADFAKAAAGRLRFPAKGRDPAQLIADWLEAASGQPVS